MSIPYTFQHDRAGDTAKLTVSFQVQDRHGPIGAQGVGSGVGWLDGEIDASGRLTAVGGGVYSGPAARPGLDPLPPEVRLTVRRGGTPISSVVFRPVLAGVDATSLNINDLLKSGQAMAATPQQLVDLANAMAETKASIQESRRVNADTLQATEELRSVAGTYSLGREPRAGDPAGTYRWVDTQGRVVDIAWNGSAETGRTVAVATRNEMVASASIARAAAQSGSALDVDWLTAEMVLNPTPVSLPTPYADRGGDPNDRVHPSVVHVPQGWNGYRYWQVYEAYNSQNVVLENPIVAASNSPEGPFEIPAGAKMPVFGPPPAGYYSDADIFIDPADNQMVLVWRATDSGEVPGAPTSDIFWCSKSADGVNWTPKTLWAAPARRWISPSVVFRGDHWLMMVTELGNGQGTFVMRSDSWQTLFAAPAVPISSSKAPDGRNIWHANMEAVGDQLVMIAQCGDSSGGSGWLAVSRDPDGIEWQWAQRHLHPFTQYGPTYRSQILPTMTADGPALDLWLGTVWRINYGRLTPRRTNTLDAGVAQTLDSARRLALPPTLLYDTFDRPDGAVDAPDVGAAWATLLYPFTRRNGKLYPVNTSGSRNVLDAGRADYRVSVTMSLEAGTLQGEEAYVLFRHGGGTGGGDVNEFLRFGWSGAGGAAQWVLQRLSNTGAATTLGTSRSLPLTQRPRRVTVTCQGQTIACAVDGVTLITATVAEFAAQTQVGIQANATTTGFDDFLVESLDGTGAASGVPRRLSAVDTQARAMQQTVEMLRGEAGKYPYLAADSFDRADVSPLGNAPFGGAWVAKSGTFAVQSGRAVGTGGNNRSVVDASVADVEAEVTLSAQPSGDAWLVLRDGAGGFLRFGGNLGNPVVLQTIGGSGASYQTTTPSALGQRWRGRLVGQQVTIWVDGKQVINATVPDFATQTGFGIQAGAAGTAFDDFLVRRA